MPPQNQPNQTNASGMSAPPQFAFTGGDASAQEFLKLEEDQQRQVLSKLSPEAKDALFTSINAVKQKGKQAAPPEDQGFLAGVGDYLSSSVTGLKNLFMQSSDQPDVGEQLRRTYSEGGKQVGEQARASASAFRGGSPTEGALRGGQAFGTALSLADPFATGPVVNINELEDQQRNQEALGQGTMAVLNLWAGSRTLRGPLSARMPTDDARINRLTAATGETGETKANYQKIYPDLAETARQRGAPETIGDLQQTVEQTSKNLESEFQADFSRIKGQRVYTPFIKNHIDRIIRENPQWAKTPDGQARIAALQRVKSVYDRPGWTFEEMNKERGTLRKEIRSYYDAPPSDAAARLKLDAEMQAKKIVAAVMAETVNEYTARAAGKQRLHFDELRQKQEAAIDLLDHLDKEVGKLQDKQAVHEAQGPLGRLKAHTYMSRSGPRMHVSGIGEALPGGGSEAEASRMTRKAFTKRPVARATRAGVLSLPIGTLLRNDQEDQPQSPGGMTPPPKPQ